MTLIPNHVSIGETSHLRGIGNLLGGGWVIRGEWQTKIDLILSSALAPVTESSEWI